VVVKELLPGETSGRLGFEEGSNENQKAKQRDNFSLSPTFCLFLQGRELWSINYTLEAYFYASNYLSCGGRW
jgi:hypothetical protein